MASFNSGVYRILLTNRAGKVEGSYEEVWLRGSRSITPEVEVKRKDKLIQGNTCPHLGLSIYNTCNRILITTPAQNPVLLTVQGKS